MITLGFYILTKYINIYFLIWYNTPYFSNSITPISYDFVYKNLGIYIYIYIYIQGGKSQQCFNSFINIHNLLHLF
jgi:hypothetical protein